MKMNQKVSYVYILVALAIGFLAAQFLVNPNKTEQAQASDITTKEATIWTCSMHPQIQQPEAGDCPICGMDLIPLESDSSDEGERELSMSESSLALADIQTSVVKREYPEKIVRLVGQLEYDETRMQTISARFPARIDRLFVNYTGIRVKAGEHLAKVYSPELFTAQQELISAYNKNPESTFTQAAREKLKLWGLLPEQVDEIIKRGTASDQFELKASLGGLVIEKSVKEGDYVETGQRLLKIADINNLWLMMDAYESDLAWLRYGQEVSFTVEAYPGETFTGKIVFIDPEVNPKTRTVAVRVNVSNPNERLKSGMFAKGEVTVRLSESNGLYAPELAGKWISPMHPEIIKDEAGSCDVCGMPLVPAEELGLVESSEEAPLVVPTSAVLQTGKRAIVYVQKTDAKEPTFEGREITLGSRADGMFIVRDGLSEGERVVTHGAFKIDSALQIQAKPSMMNPEDEDAMTEHAHHDGMEMTAGILKLDPAQASTLLPSYLTLQSALAGDNLAASKEALKSMMDIIGHTGQLPELIHTMLEAGTLDEIRKPHFETLSNALISALKENPSSASDALYIMHCPMVYGDTGADWIQSNDDLRNPYFGAMMLKCGEVKEQIK